MSFKIASDQFSALNYGANNRASAENAPAPIDAPHADEPEIYRGGRLEITVYKEDAQRDFVWRGLYEHACAAGLPHEKAAEFAQKWAVDNLLHQENGATRPYTAQEFARLKQKGAASFDLDERYSRNVLEDLRERQSAFRLAQRTPQSALPNVASMSAPQLNAAEQAIEWMTDTIDSATGSENEIGKQFNRLSVSGLRLMGQLQDLQNKATEAITGAVRTVAPDAVDNALNAFDETRREQAKALQNAASTVTKNDAIDDLMAAKAGIKRPVAEDLHRRLMYAPEAIPSAIDSAIKGDFKEDDGSYSDKVGKFVGGLNPVGDVRDIIANGKQLIETGDWKKAIPLGASVLGAIPIGGDVLKPIIKAEKEAIAGIAEKLVKQGVEKEAAEKLAKEEVEKLVKEAVEKRYDEIAKSGHAVQRHGESVTERQLDERAMYGKDPITGTTDDAFNKFPDGTPKPHNFGKDATKFKSKEALVKAENYIINSQEYKDALNNAGSLDNFAVRDIKLEDVFGADYKNQVFGKTRVGSRNNPTGTIETDFTDGTIKGVYKKDSTGNWKLETMFPEAK